jgi:hypothetical protein
MTLQSEPVAMADAIRDFDAASLFIDDCPDGTINCTRPGTGYIGALLSTGFCYNWGSACCAPCASGDVNYWDQQCNSAFADACSAGDCEAFYSETFACGTH